MIELDGCIVWNTTIQYSARSGVLSMHKLFTSCIRRCLVSRACDWVMAALSAVLLIFSFQFRSVFLPCRSARPQSGAYWFTQYRTSDFAENLGIHLSCTRRTVQGNDCELILTVKLESRYLAEGYFGSEFWAICNHCGFMAAWSRKFWKFVQEFLRYFLEKRPLTVKLSKFCSKSFHRDTDPRCCVQISWNVADGKSAKSYVIYLTKNLGCLSNCHYCADRAQICQGQPQQCTQSAPDFIQIGSLSAEL